MSVLNPHMHAWSPHNAVLVTSFHLKIVSCTPSRQVSKAWTSILEMSRFVRSLVTNAFLCLAFKLCDGSQSILHDHQQIVHTMDVQVFYYCNILIRRYVGEAWQPRPRRGMHASQKAKARHVITSSSHIPTAVVVVSLRLWTRHAAVYRPDVRSRPKELCFLLLIAKMRQFCSEKWKGCKAYLCTTHRKQMCRKGNQVQ